MTAQVKLVFVLTFTIHLIGMLSYAVRIAGVRTRRIAVSLALFNILLLISRTSNTFQGPLLAKHVEQNISVGSRASMESDLRWLIVAATLASVVGMLIILTFQRLGSRAIAALESLLFVFIDPYLSLLTDDVVTGRATEAHFRRCIVMLAASRTAGTVIAQLLLTPAAGLIVVVANHA